MAKSGPRSNARPRASAKRPRPSKKRPARTRKPPATRATRQTKTRASTRKATATRKGYRAGSAKRATRKPTTRATTTTSKAAPRTPRATAPASKAKPKTPRAADAKRRRVRPPGLDRPRRVLADMDPSIGRVTGAVRPDGSSSADTPVPVRSRTPGKGATPAETPVATAGSLADLIARIRAEKM